MIVKAKKDRELILIRAQNTQNENKAETIEIEVPEEYESYNKKIVFITTDGTVWDIITNNEYKITNAITKYKQVDFYIWLTKEVNGESIDFRSKTKTLRFYDNIDASDEITPEEIHGVNTVVNLLEDEIEKVENLNIEATKIGSTTTITITKKDGTTESIEINDGTDGQDGRDGKDGDDYVITQQDYQNIANIVEQEINIPSKTSQLQNDSGFITNAVNNLTNYYLKSETYTQTEVNSLIGAISTMNLQVVQTLPTQDISTTTIYLVPKTTAETNDAYDEYIYVSNNWEHIGSTEVDLTGYATESWVNTQISNFLTETEIQQLINTAVNQKYTKPALGIPKTDLASDVQTSLGKADTALQEHQDISGKEDKTNKVTSIDNTSTDTQYPSAKCVYDSQEEQNTEIEKLQTENARLKATLPTTTGEGQDVTLDKTAEMEFVKPPLPRGNSEQNTTTGKNLLNTINANTTTVNGVTSYRSNGFYYLSGTNTKTDATWVLPNVQNTNLPTFEIGQTYTMSFKGTLPSGIYAQLNGVKASTGTQYSIGSVMRTVPYITFTIDSDYSSTAQLFIGVQATVTNADCNFAIQIEKGPATSYEPYTNGPSPNPDYPQEIRNVTGNVEVTISNENNTESKTLPVSLGNIELCKIGDCQDYFYKESNKWYLHKEIDKVVLDGSESWAYSSSWSKTNTNVFYLATILTSARYTRLDIVFGIANEFKVFPRDDLYTNDIDGLGYSGSIGSPYITTRINKTIAPDVTAFTTWLRNNNLIYYYQLNTPTDTEITDTTLISQLEEISKTLSYQGQTNISSNTIALFDVEAYQSTKLILQNINSRLTLVEG